MDRRFRPCSPAVVSEVIAGEAIIMNLESGRYFSALGSGAAIWNWITQGRTIGEIGALLARRYRLDEGFAAAQLDSFLAELRSHELIVEEPGATGVQLVDATAPSVSEADSIEPGEAEPYVPPQLSVYSDMKDLLLLDPIHDVDATGWPAPAKAA